MSRVEVWLAARLVAGSAKVREVEAVQLVVAVGFDSIGSVAAVCMAPVVLVASAVEGSRLGHDPEVHLEYVRFDAQSTPALILHTL